MANKPMGFFNIGSDTYEVVDVTGRQSTQELALTVSQLSASNLPYSSTQSTKEKIDEPIVKMGYYSASKSVTASGTAWLSFSDFNITAISGYTLVGVVGWHITGTTSCFIRSLNSEDSSDFVALTNTSNVAQNAIVNVNCLYIKTEKIVTS